MNSDETTFHIDRLNFQGEGIAQDDGNQITVPFSLPGEVVTLEGNGRRRSINTIELKSASRITPVCEHFGTCGGCQLQHFEEEAYLNWKRNILIDALAQQGITHLPEPIISAGGRRRAIFSAAHTREGIVFGFSQKKSHNITPIQSCPVLVPGIHSQLEIIKHVIEPLVPAKSSIRIWVVDGVNGLDIQVSPHQKYSPQKIQTAINRAIDKSIARLSLGDEVLIETVKPLLEMGEAKIVPPPGAFIQASANAEKILSDLVCQHLKNCKKTVDLYCGTGTFALRMAQHSTVIGYENSASAIATLDLAWRNTGGKLKHLSAQMRDLERRPVMADELKKIDGAVFDPPRGGAEIQVRQLAISKVKKIAAVSCNPTTLARDAKMLLDAGFKLISIHPIDQFIYTPHLETVALFEK